MNENARRSAKSDRRPVSRLGLTRRSWTSHAENLLLLDERDRYLIEAVRFFPALSHRETAHRMRSRLLIYSDMQDGSKRRCGDLEGPRSCAERAVDQGRVVAD